MKRTTLVVLCAAALAVSFANSASATGISAGDVVVTRVLSTSGGNAAAAVIDEYNSTTAAQAAPNNTVTLPTATGTGTTPNAFALSGSAASEGFLKLSSNGQYLTLAGYAATPGTVNPQSSSASVVNRVVARVTVSSGAVDTTTALNNVASTSNIRGAASDDGTNLWVSSSGIATGGNSAGVTYTTLGATTGTRVNTTGDSGTNRRVVGISNGQLYVTAMSGTSVLLDKVGTGLPTGASAEAILPGMANPSPIAVSTYDFFFKDANTVYLADDATAANGGGIQKWTFNGSTWSLAYILLSDAAAGSFVGTTTTGTRGLDGFVNGSGNAVLFATSAGTSANNLITVTDTGQSATATILATAAAGTAFRGVAYVPVPEPSTVILAGLGLIGLVGCARRRMA